MKCSKKVIFINLIFLMVSCVTTGGNLPDWVEIKPANNSKEIYFVYGPAESRDRAKEGLYKEISEFFGVKVSSVDKFVKQVTFENGERDISQSKESQIDVTSREKGLDSIEIREIWSDNSKTKWCVLASLSREAEDKIKKAVEAEVEAERVANVLNLGESNSRELENLYNSIESKIKELKKLEIDLEQSLNKISGMVNATDIMELSSKGLKIGEDIDQLLKEINRLTNEAKIIQAKNSLLNNQLKNNSIALLQLDFFVTESMDILKKVESRSADIGKIKNDSINFVSELNRLYLKSELDILGDKESNKLRLFDELKRIENSVNRISIIKDEVELLYKQSEDLLRSLKQVAYSDSLTRDDKIIRAQDLLNKLDDSFNKARDGVDNAYRLKSSINLDQTSAFKSQLITDDQKSSIKKMSTSVNSPVSWIEIYKDKIVVNLNSGKKVVDELINK